MKFFTSVKDYLSGVGSSRRTRIFLFVLLDFFYILRILLLPSQELNHTYYVSLIPLLIAPCILWMSEKMNLKYSLQALALTILFLFQLSLKEILKTQCFFTGMELVVFILVLSGAIFVCLLFLLDSIMVDRTDEQERSYSRTTHVVDVLFVLEAFVFLMADYPFRPATDALTVYNSAMSGEWSDWHTIGYQSFVRFCVWAGKPFFGIHPFPVCLVQAILWILIVFYIAHELKACLGEKAAMFWKLANMVMLVQLVYLGVVYKDVVFSMFITGFCGELFVFLYKDTKGFMNYLLLCVFAVGTMLFRHAAWPPVLIALVSVTLCFLKKKDRAWRILLMESAFILIIWFMFVQVFGARILHMEKNPEYVKYTVPLYITGYMVANAPDAFEGSDIELLEQVMPMEEWRDGYLSDTYWGDTLSRSWGYIGERIESVNDAYGKELLKLNLRLLVRRPSGYVNALLRVTSIVWQIARPEDGYEWRTIGKYYKESEMPELAEGALVSKETVLQVIAEKSTGFLAGFPLTSFLYCRGGIWIFILVLELIVLWAKNRRAVVISMLPLFIVFLLLMISCPSQDPRFVLPFMDGGILFLAIAIYMPTRRPVL